MQQILGVMILLNPFIYNSYRLLVNIDPEIDLTVKKKVVYYELRTFKQPYFFFFNFEIICSEYNQESQEHIHRKKISKNFLFEWHQLFKKLRYVFCMDVSLCYRDTSSVFE